VNRILVLVAAIFAGIAIVALLNLCLPADSIAAQLLIDKRIQLNSAGVATVQTNPLAIQTFLWIAFMAGLGEVFLRIIGAQRENREVSLRLLPEAPDVLLEARDLVPIYRRVHESGSTCFLPRLIERVILQFQSSKSVDRSSSMLAASIELFSHEVDLRYHLLRFYAWLIPSLGFLGTVIGIVAGLNVAAVQYMENAGEVNLADVTSALSVAFYSTWLALLMAAVLVFLIHVAQEVEERALNRSAQYCLDHLINKLMEG
jgi:biopolymer transport protein ExbB/TolQ